MYTVIHQFYMIPSLRKDILSIHNDHFEQISKENSLIYHLKEIFQVHDEETDESVSVEAFCKVFTEVNSKIQVDAANFLLDLISKIDKEAQTLNLPLSLEECFKGEFENKVTSKTCNLEKTINEDFIIIPVSIEKLKNLDESLEMFFMREALAHNNYYYCEQCNMKHEALLERNLKKIPNYLIFEMKRAIFDLDILYPSLIDSSHELPNTLNIQSYTKNNHSQIEKEENKYQDEREESHYKLSGVVIYQGTEKSGKYSSLIRDREAQDKWYKVDRDGKKEFDHENISRLAFENPKESWAHLVIYDKIQTSNFHIYEREP